MAQIDTSGGGKKKKGAQKKIAIHVDFTPMVDMNMLLITFFMLCTTMIKSQTLQIILPTNEEVRKEQQSQAKQSEAITLILDTEYNGDTPAVDAETGKTVHNIYYYEGIADTTFATPNYLRREQFIGNVNREAQGIRRILLNKNQEVMAAYQQLKERWKNREITKEEFDREAKKNASDSSCCGNQTRSQHHLRGSHQCYRRNEHQPDFTLQHRASHSHRYPPAPAVRACQQRDYYPPHRASAGNCERSGTSIYS